jgi:hypothetical protein
MTRLALAIAALLAAPVLARAQGAASTGLPPGFTFTAAMGGGGELGLERGQASVLEVEAAAGYEAREIGLRGELAVALGIEPDTNLALRPGLRWQLPGAPIQLRVALDVSNARDEDWGWRWLLVGAATELRVTGLFGLYGEIDTGVPLRGAAGVPLLLRAGASFRF